MLLKLDSISSPTLEVDPGEDKAGGQNNLDPCWTKNTHWRSGQFYAMACREYTLPRNDGSSQPKGWIQGNTKIGPVLEVTTSCLYVNKLRIP